MIQLPALLILLGLAAPIASFGETATFQNGLSGYTGGDDTQILAWGAPSNYGGRIDMDVGRLDAAQDGRGLVRFDLSSLNGQIGTVTSATLRLTWSPRNNYSVANSTLTQVAVYQMAAANASWGEGTFTASGAGNPAAGNATWNQRAAPSTAWAGSTGASTSGTDYVAALLASVDAPDASAGLANTTVDFNLTGDLSFIKGWADGTVANAGFVLRDTSGTTTARRVNFNTNEVTTVAYRPMLILNYTTSEPVAPMVATGAATEVTATTARLRATVTSTGNVVPDVTIYYGPADGGTTAAAWASSVSLGAQSSSASAVVSGLATGTVYYFRAFAQNTAGSAWAAGGGTFTTQAVTLPAITLGNATAITGSTALVSGQITDTGNDAPVVTLYYGTTDGGTVAGAWTGSVALGAQSGFFGGQISGLSANTAYFLRAAATNAAGTVWSAPTRTFSTNTAVAGVVINEVHFDPDNKLLPLEFIELYNASAAPVSLTGWTLSDGVQFAFPAGTTIAAAGYLVISENPAAHATAFPASPAALGPWTGSLDNDGERIQLRDALGLVHDEVDYQAEFPWAISANGEGASLQLIHSALDNNLAGSWRGAPPSPGAVNANYATWAPPQLRQVEHLPQTPTSAQPIVVTVKATDPDGVGGVTLHYQAVAPGAFIPAFFPLPYATLVNTPAAARTPNPAFENPGNWTALTMLDNGSNGDLVAGDAIFTATIPAQANRTLVRYRIDAADTLNAAVRVPYADDPSLNFACFVYNGVPAYTAESRTVRPEGPGYTYTATVMNSLPVHTLITRPEDLRSCNAYSSLGDAGQQIPKSNDAARSAFNWEGAFVHYGVVYDHMNYRLRQANDRYAGDGKRSMRFRFQRGHYFQARDHEGKRTREKWESLNTGKMSRFAGANVSGVREVVSAELWRLFGVDMPHYFHGHFRVIDGADEAPAGLNGQHLGDFFGLAMFTEDFEGSFLANRDLPDGNIYKWKDGFTNPATLKQFQATGAATDGSDFNAIYTQLRPERDTTWLRERVDWDNWYRYHGIVEAVRHYDFGVTSAHLKNRGWYFMPVAGAPQGLLRHIPHDFDASWYRGYHDGLTVGIGVDFPMQAIYGTNGVTEKPEFTTEYRNTLRELRDLLWRPEVVEPMIDRVVARIAAFHDADRDRWLSAPAAAGFETGVTPLATVVNDMKNFAFVADTVNGATLAGGRSAYLDQLSNDAAIPDTPAITYTGTANYPSNGVAFTASAYNGTNAAAVIEWRLAEITDATAPAYDPLAPQMYEITAMWTVKNAAPFSSEQTIPMLALRPGHTYRVRARHTDSTARVSHWSEPAQFTVTAPNVAGFQAALVVSEVNYNPAPTTQAERDAGFLDSDLFEWIEVKNISAGPVDMTGLRFTKGADFDFPAGYIIPAGGFSLVVKNVNAFRQRWGTSFNAIIAGSYGTSNLSNGGEEIKLSYGAGTAVREFLYDDIAPWPSSPDGTGYTLVLKAPATSPDHILPANWRASAAIGGSPGADDIFTYALWATQHPGIGDANTNPDGDELNNRLEYAFAGDPGSPGTAPVTGGVQSGYLTITFRRRTDASDLAFTPQFSTDLTDWSAATDLVTSAAHADGTVTETWRAPVTVTSASRLFIRVQVD